jgi:homoserine dehydrogenase
MSFTESSPASTETSRFPIVVLKFGSSVLRSGSDLATAVTEIYRHVRVGRRVLAVVSAFPGVTDRLVRSAKSCFSDPDPVFLASLLASGETASASILAMALEEAGVPVTILDPAEAGLRVSGPPLDASPVALNTLEVLRKLEGGPVVIVPGFFGRSLSGTISLLGRGGSDLTAIFMAHALGAETCRLLKDVDGLYSTDPKHAAGMGRRYSAASWEEAIRIGDGVVQPKALEFARKHRVHFALAGTCSPHETVVGSGPVRYAQPNSPNRLLRVALLGLGTVGLGVFHRLATQRDRFVLVGIAVRDLRKPRDPRVARGLLVDDAEALLRQPLDVVIELIGGQEPAMSLIRLALKSACHVISANKAVVALHGPSLDDLARSRGVTFRYSASVGGSVPVLEQLRGLTADSELRCISGVLNGTSNYVLDKMAEGVTLARAVQEAQREGFAEADPRLDLCGTDSAHKLAIVARAAFGVDLKVEDVECRGIEGIQPRDVLSARSSGRMVRLVASCRRTPDGIKAEVRPRALRDSHPLSRARGVENRVLLRAYGKPPVLLSGKGAGRWPTSLAVFADLLDVYLDWHSSQRVTGGAVRSATA